MFLLTDTRGEASLETMPSLEMRGAAMSLTAAATGFVVLLLSASVIQGEGEWGVTYTSTPICALKGSTVTIRCSYKHPARKDGTAIKVEKTFWFTERRGDEYIDLKTVSEYSNRVQDHCEKNDCTLTIRNLRESDSAEYYFRFITNKDKYYGQPGVTLSVTDLDLWVSRYLSQYLQCRSSCPSDQTSYIWYKNRQKLEETSAYLGFTFGSADSYSCALRGYEDFPSPSVYAPKTPVVSVSPSAEIMEGTSVTLTCSSDAKPAATYTWYKENIIYVRKQPKFVFGTIQSSDSGQYYCEAENLLGNMKSKHIYLDVKYAPKPAYVSVSPSAGIVEGSSVTLTCSSDANPAANYTWYKENKESPKASGQIFIITNFRAEHSGNYYCEAKNTRGRRNSTLQLIVAAAFPEAWKIVVVGTAPGFVLVIIWHSVFFLIRKRRASKKPSKPGERADNREQSADQGDLHYASVQFVKNQTDPVYSNIRPTGLHIDEEEEEEEEEEVKYATVNFNSGPLLRTSDQESVEDPAAVYSTVSKTT